MAQTNTAARDYWNGLMQRHQGLNFFLTLLTSLLGYLLAAVRYFFSGHWFVALAKQGIVIAGRIATSVLFFVALWVAGRTTEPGTMAHVLSVVSLGHVKDTQADHFAVIAFTLLPDCLLLGCILLTIDQWVLAFKRGGQYWIWMGAYTIFTCLFMFIAVYTFCSFLQDGGGIQIQAGKVDGMTILRAVSGWLYALTEMIHAGVMAKYGKEQQAAEASSPALDLQAQLSWSLVGLAALMQERMDRAMASLQMQVEQRLAGIAVEQARMLTSFQHLQATSAPAPAIDHQALIAGVLGELEPRFTSALQHLESEIHQQVRVSVERETTQVKLLKNASETPRSVSPAQGGTALPGPKLVSLPQRNGQSGTLKRVQMERESAPSSPSAPEEVTDAKSTIYRLMEEDNTRQVANLMQLTGLPKTTVWRHWNRYHEEHGTRGQARIVTGAVEHAETVETAW